MTDSDDSIERSVYSLTESLLLRARRGDADAWKRLVAIYRRLVCWWCLRGGIPAQDVDDVVQDSFGALAGALPTYAHRCFRGFLRKIVINKIHDYWRAHDSQLVFDSPVIEQFLLNDETRSSGDSDRESTSETKLVFDAVVQWIRDAFSEQDWLAFWAVAVEGRTAEEASQQLGVTRNQVYLAKSRILRRIRAEFGESGENVFR